MAVDKRRSKHDPLTEHDYAERLDRAALRALRILSDARELGIRDDVVQSRFLGGGLLAALAHELVVGWEIEPRPLKANVTRPL